MMALSHPSPAIRICLAAYLAIAPGAMLSQTPARPPAGQTVPQNGGGTAMHKAARTGDLTALRAQLKQGADPNVRDRQSRTPLMVAAESGQAEAARLLIASGADLNVVARGWGSALEIAERSGHHDIAALLRNAGARSSGRSVGDKVCVRPWNGDGYCGIVQSVNRNSYRIRVTQIIGCKSGCGPKPECSAGRQVGGPVGIAVGDEVNTVSWCLTHTGVKP
ncbi:MAG TPA: ankyrin repeat domain-containing protein [Terriglobales bacterium]|nr:ankyrin repeat domain-containing protein [Terriglobales bacterium]